MSRAARSALLAVCAALGSVDAAPDGGKAPASGTPKLELGKLSREEAPAGCACSVYGPDSERLVFDPDMGGGRSLIKVDGKLHRLERTRGGFPKMPHKKGDTFFEELTSSDLRVRLDRTVSFVCPPDDEVCEVTEYKVDLTLQQGGAQRTYRGLKGSCGC